VDDTGGVNVFQATEDLIQEVLDELLFKGSRSQETVQIGTQELGNEIAAMSENAFVDIGQRTCLQAAR
jgi:hypothetical protein